MLLKKYLESVAANSRTQMLFKRPPLETFIKTIRSRMLSKFVRRNSVAKNNRPKMLLRKLPLATFVKKMRSKMLLGKY